MARSIKTSFVIEGESACRNTIKAINSEYAVLKSQMAVVTSEFKNNQNSVEALTAKGEVLTKMYDSQSKGLQAMRSAMESAQKTQTEAAAKVEEYKKKISETEESLKKLKSSTGDTSEEQAKLTKELEDLKAKLLDAENGQARAGASAEEWQKKSNYAQAALNNLSGEIDNNNAALEEAQHASRKAGETVEDMGDKLNASGEDAESFGKKSSQGIDALASALAAAGVQQALSEIKEQLTECLNASIEFNKGTAEAFTLIPDASDTLKTRVTSDLLELSTTMGIASEDSTSALYQTMSAGVSAGESIEFMTTAQKAAVGGVTTLTTSVDGLTSVTNAYGRENLSAQQAADLMFTAVKLGKTNFEQLSSSLYNVVPVAASNKIAFEDITAALAAMTVQGTGVQIEYSTSSNGTTWGGWTLLDTVKTTSGSGNYKYNPSLTRGHRIRYRVRVTGSAGAIGYSPYSSTVSTKKNALPTAPTTLDISDSAPSLGDEITVTWAGADDPDDNIVGYELYVKGKLIQTVETSEKSGTTLVSLPDAIADGETAALSIITVDSYQCKSPSKSVQITRTDRAVYMGSGGDYPRCQVFIGSGSQWKKAQLLYGMNGAWQKILAGPVTVPEFQDVQLKGKEITRNVTASGLPIQGKLYGTAESGADISISVSIENQPMQALTILEPMSGIKVETNGIYSDTTGQEWICDEFDFTTRTLTKRVRNGAVLDQPETLTHDLTGYPPQLVSWAGTMVFTCSGGEMALDFKEAVKS